LQTKTTSTPRPSRKVASAWWDGPRGFYRADDLAHPGLGPPLFQVGPEVLEARLGVGDRYPLVQNAGVREADLGHVLRLGDVDPDEEPIPPRAQRLLELAKALDSDCI
jgi:hypothetical protein